MRLQGGVLYPPLTDRLCDILLGLATAQLKVNPMQSSVVVHRDIFRFLLTANDIYKVVTRLRTTAHGSLHAGLSTTHTMHIYSWMQTNQK